MITYNNSLINSKLQHPSLSPPPPLCTSYLHLSIVCCGGMGNLDLAWVGRSNAIVARKGGGNLNEPTYQTNSISV